jgi:hypothetical protein
MLGFFLLCSREIPRILFHRKDNGTLSINLFMVENKGEKIVSSSQAKGQVLDSNTHVFRCYSALNSAIKQFHAKNFHPRRSVFTHFSIRT